MGRVQQHVKRRPLRRLVRAERRVAAVLRGTGPLYRAGRAFRQPPTAEQRQEDRARRFLKGWSQRKGGGWSIREAPWKPRVPETPCELPDAPQDWILPLVPWGWETGEPWQRLTARLRRAGASIKTWLRRRWRYLRYAEPLPPAREPTNTERVVGWSLAAAGVLVLTLILPRHIALWCAPLLGMAQMQLLDTGDSEEDHHGDKGRVGGQKLNQNMMLTLMCAATLNVGWFASDQNRGTSLGLTAPQIIQAAINYGMANGFEAAWIPKKAAGVTLLPYDASAVTFNAALRMLREGGPTELATVDAQAYGAGNDSSRAALQAAADAIEASQKKGRRLYIGGQLARYGIDQPILIRTAAETCGDVVMNPGAGCNSWIAPTFAYGPAFVVCSSADAIPTDTALLTGAGSSIHFTDSTRWFNLRDAATLELDGLAQFCAEATIKPDTVSAGEMIVSSYGVFLGSDSVSSAFSLSIGTGFGAGFVCKIGGVTKSLSSGAGTIVAATQYHIAGSYDGSTVRLFLNGNVVASTAASGSITQGVAEDVTVGPRLSVAPDGQVFTGAMIGRIDSLRISSTARYAVGFTPPTAKFSTDGSTLALMNSDVQVGPCAKVYTKDGVLWAYMRDQNNGGGVAGSRFHDLLIQNAGGLATSGIFVGRFSPNSVFERLNFLNCRIGIGFFTGDCYEWKANNLWFSGSAGVNTGRFAIQCSGNAGIASLSRIDIQSACRVGIVCKSGLVDMTGVFIESTADLVFGLLLAPQTTGTSFSIRNLLISTEAGTGSAFRAPVGASFGASIGLQDSEMETAGSAPFFIADSIKSANIVNSKFVTGVSTPSIFSILGSAPAQPISVQTSGPRAGTSWKPWSDTLGTVSVTKIGKGSVIAFSATPAFDCSLRDEPELGTLTATVTAANLTNATPGQTISVKVLQDGPGTRGWTWGTVNGAGSVKGASAIDAAANHWSLWVLEIGLDGNAYQRSFNSGA